MVVWLAFIFESQATVRNVIQVLEPLEERHGDTASIYVQI